VTPIVHIVLVKWQADMPASTMDRLTELVNSFPSAIPGVLEVVHGPSVSTENLEAGYEWALVVTFADSLARDGYLDHPAHAPVSELIGTWSERLVVFDLAR
jgi:hypothetical protein